MKVIFFDIDGTLNHPGTYAAYAASVDQPCPTGYGARPLRVPLDAACVTRLNWLVAQTGAVLVVVSSWRLYARYDVLGPALARGGVVARVVDQTPDLTADLARARALRVAWCLSPLEGADGIPWVTRGTEVQAWLVDHPDVESFVVLDDQDDYDHLVDRLIRVNPVTGLSDGDITRAAEILRTPRGVPRPMFPVPGASAWRPFDPVKVQQCSTWGGPAADCDRCQAGSCQIVAAQRTERGLDPCTLPDLTSLPYGEPVDVGLAGRTFRLMRTQQVGIHSGRPRYSVTCLSCGEVVHEATTGPVQNVEFHVRDAQARCVATGMSSVPARGRTWQLYAHAIRGTYHHIGSKQWVDLHCSSAPVVSVIAREWLGDARDPEVTHYGWESAEKPGRVTMIYPRAKGTPWLLLEMCFPFGIEAGISAGMGKRIALQIVQNATDS